MHSRIDNFRAFERQVEEIGFRKKSLVSERASERFFLPVTPPGRGILVIYASYTTRGHAI